MFQTLKSHQVIKFTRLLDVRWGSFSVKTGDVKTTNLPQCCPESIDKGGGPRESYAQAPLPSASMVSRSEMSTTVLDEAPLSAATHSTAEQHPNADTEQWRARLHPSPHIVVRQHRRQNASTSRSRNAADLVWPQPYTPAFWQLLPTVPSCDKGFRHTLLPHGACIVVLCLLSCVGCTYRQGRPWWMSRRHVRQRASHVRS
jgi:hypothetical protein